MRVLVSMCRSRGDVEPLGGLAPQSCALGAMVPVCPPPDSAAPLARVGEQLVSAATEG